MSTHRGKVRRLPLDTARCLGTTCGKRDICARFMDVQPGDGSLWYMAIGLYSDGSCDYFIEYKPEEK